VLSQLCRNCQGNNAEAFAKQCTVVGFRRAFGVPYPVIYALTSAAKLAILTLHSVLAVEVLMADEKLRALRASQTLHPHPERVRDPLFISGSPFFDPRDLVQVKYELLRRVRVEGEAVSQAAARFGLSRPTYYTALAAWERAGLIGLLPQPTGPRQAHKLTPEILARLLPHAATQSSAQLAEWLREHEHLRVHPRSIERALARAAQKGGTQWPL